MTLYFTNEEQKLIEEERKQINFSSSLGFLAAHNGLRRGSLHIVLGTTGGGKSTLVRTILRDILFQKGSSHQVAVWLSEESVSDYKSQFAHGVPSCDELLRTHAYSEIDNPDCEKEDLFAWLDMIRPDVFIFDNITTSKLYNDKKVSEQGTFATRIKQITKTLNMATIAIAHTDAKANDTMGRLLNINDIRGSKNIANLCEFAYILQRFEIDDKFYPTIRIVKHRSQDLLHNMYYLEYDKTIRAFSKDRYLDFKEFKELYAARNKLDK